MAQWDYLLTPPRFEVDPDLGNVQLPPLGAEDTILCESTVHGERCLIAIDSDEPVPAGSTHLASGPNLKNITVTQAIIDAFDSELVFLADRITTDFLEFIADHLVRQPNRPLAETHDKWIEIELGSKYKIKAEEVGINPP
jgi:hypothetical protein